MFLPILAQVVPPLLRFLSGPLVAWAPVRPLPCLWGRHAIQSQSEIRVLGLHGWAKDKELGITAAWKALRPLRNVLNAKSLAMSARWLRWKAEVAPVPALGAWRWRWSHEVWRAINTTAIRMLRPMARIPRTPDEPWLGLHVRSWRSYQAWVLLKEGGPLGHRDAVPCNPALRLLDRP